MKAAAAVITASGVLPFQGSAQDTSLPMGPYREIRAGTISAHQRENWEIVKNNKEDLDEVLAACRKKPTQCERLIAFDRIIDRIADLDDPIQKIAAVNMAVNTMVAYDFAENERAKTNREHKSLVVAIVSGQAICDEQAQLKYYALDRLGFSSRDLRLVSENVYQDGEPIAGHRIVEVRVDGKNWVLSNNQYRSYGIISPEDANNIAILNSLIENDAAHLGPKEKSPLRQNLSHDVKYQPASAYTYEGPKSYSHDPNGKPDKPAMVKLNIRPGDPLMGNIVLAAMMPHYAVKHTQDISPDRDDSAQLARVVSAFNATP